MKGENNNILYFAIGLIVIGLIYVLFTTNTSEGFATDKKKQVQPAVKDKFESSSGDKKQPEPKKEPELKSFNLSCSSDPTGNITCIQHQ